MSTYTEADAQTKWCPFVRHVAVGIGGGAAIYTNRFTDGGPETGLNGNCIASRCMAWKKSGRLDANNKELGYCGLTGLGGTPYLQ